jgi:hypothetical protein
MTQREQAEVTTEVRHSPCEIVPDRMDLWARASSAEAWAEDCADRDLGEQALEHYRAAVACYDEIGSSRDSARVRVALARLVTERAHARRRS